MGFEEILTVILNNGTSVGCLVYFMYFNKVHAERTNEILQELKTTIMMLQQEIEELRKERGGN